MKPDDGEKEEEEVVKEKKKQQGKEASNNNNQRIRYTKSHTGLFRWIVCAEGYELLNKHTRTFPYEMNMYIYVQQVTF